MNGRRVWLTLAFAALACDRQPPAVHVAFGVFYGGQIQDRRALALDLDGAHERHGIRVDFARPLEHERLVSWEIARPLPGARQSREPDAGLEQVVEVGRLRARVGAARLDVPLEFRPGQRPGLWHVRVQVDGKTELERDVSVFDPKAPPPDAGPR